MKKLYILLLVFLCGSLSAQYPNPNSLQTGNDGMGGRLADLSFDSNWDVALGPDGATSLPTNLVYEDALVIIGCPVGAWYSPTTDIVNGFTFPNSTWITYDFGGSSPCNHQTSGDGDVDLFFRLSFELPDGGPCGGSIDGNFCYVMDFMSDNQVYQIYVNGLPQFDNPQPDYGNTGFFYSNREFIELCSDWQGGLNEMIVHVKSGTSLAGFLAQARIPELPLESTTPVCISNNEITLELVAPDFTAELSPEDLDAGSYSLCNGVELDAENTTFTCADIGENISTLIVSATVNNGFQSSCQTIINVVEGNEPCPLGPCNDLSASLIPNPDFEDLAVDGQEPNDNSQLSRAAQWEQATGATSDYFSLSSYPTRTEVPDFLCPVPPNGSDHFVGAGRGSSIPRFDPESGEEQVYLEYVGACLLSPIVENITYTIILDLGAPVSNVTPEILESEVVVLGIPDCNFPINGQECKEDNFEIIGTKSISIIENTWQQNVEIELFSSVTYPAIMFGLRCADEPGYLLMDNILVIQGENPCPSDCFTITADSPPCNSDIETESLATYTYDFTFTNNNEATFDKILLFDNDENFSMDAGGTLIQLDQELEPGQSIDLSWEINADNFVAETTTYCFEIAPYNHDGPCCKAQHCVELESCCTEQPGQTKNFIDSETECCYEYGFDNCIPDNFLFVVFDMVTENLGLSATALLDGYQVLQQTDSRIMLLRSDGGFIPEGSFDDVIQFCVEGMNASSPEEQEITITWGTMIGDNASNLEPELCTLACPIPPDACAELIDPVLYCDDNNVYHYSFSVKNVNIRMLDASIVVLGPAEGSATVPTDFSQATFPDFPDHTPNGDPYLVYDMTTDIIDITLPNASLGDSYEFIISLHDYRNINVEDGEYWCCYTPIDFTIDVDVLCAGGSGSLSSNPVYFQEYPNPASTQVSIEFVRPLEEDSIMYMVDINGNTISVTNLEKGTHKHTFDVSEQVTGLYYLRVIADSGQSHIQRFLKN